MSPDCREGVEKATDAAGHGSSLGGAGHVTLFTGMQTIDHRLRVLQGRTRASSLRSSLCPSAQAGGSGGGAGVRAGVPNPVSVRPW
eukprot:scaffold273260_cov16-Tisochrysis_lutea.AAC.1